MKPVHQLGMAAMLLVLGSFPACAADLALLRNGFSIRNERHEPRETMTRLYFSESSENYVDIPTVDILGYEAIEAPPAPAPVPAAAPISAAAPAVTLGAVMDAAGSRNNIDPDLIASVIRAESGFNPSAVSRKGAQGLMQLMPQTAASLGVQNAMDPADNVEGGTRYLRDLLDRYHNDLLKTLAAYNAGPQSVEQYHGVPPYRETRAYITRIIQDLNRKKSANRANALELLTNPKSSAQVSEGSGSTASGNGPLQTQDHKPAAQ
jgi:soluble lytic murein transglycosylase-like protein